MDEKQFLETWDIHDRINLYLLDATELAALASLSASKGRAVGEQFAHLHNVRLMWLKSAAPDLLAGLLKPASNAAQSGPFRKGTCVPSDVGGEVRFLNEALRISQAGRFEIEI